MPTSRVISRIAVIEDRIREIQKITELHQKSAPKKAPLIDNNGSTFSEILNEVMQTNSIAGVFGDSGGGLLDNRVDTLLEMYKQNGEMPVSQPKALHHAQTANPSTWDDTISRTARITGVDEQLIHAVIQVESAYNPNAVSRAGAEGLMQLMPLTALEVGVNNSFNPEQNIAGGAAYLKKMLDRYDGDLIKSLAAYNAGPDAVDRANGIPNYKETQAYVPKVLNLYYNLKNR